MTNGSSPEQIATKGQLLNDPDSLGKGLSQGIVEKQLGSKSSQSRPCGSGLGARRSEP